jgi:hypothetical protein
LAKVPSVIFAPIFIVPEDAVRVPPVIPPIRFSVPLPPVSVPPAFVTRPVKVAVWFPSVIRPLLLVGPVTLKTLLPTAIVPVSVIPALVVTFPFSVRFPPLVIVVRPTPLSVTSPFVVSVPTTGPMITIPVAPPLIVALPVTVSVGIVPPAPVAVITPALVVTVPPAPP